MKTTDRLPSELMRENRSRREAQPAERPAADLAGREATPPAHSLARVSILPPEGFQGHSAGETSPNAATVVETANIQVVAASPESNPQPVEPIVEPTPGGTETTGEAVELQGGQPQQAAPAAVTAPSLTLAPGGTLTRGDTLTATINFTPAAGSTLVVRRWRYTAGAINVTRPTSDANFNTSWAGTMVISGTLELTYRIDQGTTRGTEASVTENITVNDRSGAPWESSVTENAEIPYTGQPSPPQRFPQLGVHTVDGSKLPQVTSQAVAGGPNKGFTFAQSLQAGSYISQPKIHPDLSDPKSAFMVFHQQAGLLFRTPAAAGARTHINQPNITFSGTPSTADFSVPQWETFFKAINHFTITFRQGRKSITLVDADWSLDSNARDANLSITPAGDSRIRAALGLSATDALPTATITPRGAFTVFLLLAGPAIHTGTQSHEYVHAEHSHRGNYKKMMRALDPQRKAESKLFNPGATQSYATTISDWWTQIANGMASHKLVDETQSRDQEKFVDSGANMAGVNEDPANGNNLLGNVWNITGDDAMRN